MRVGMWVAVMWLGAVGWTAAQTTVGATGEGSSETLVVVAPAGSSGSRSVAFETMPARPVMGNGMEVRDALRGVLPTGEGLAVHETVVPQGTPPNPPHVIEHTEVITVVDGTVEFLHDGKADLVPRGGVIYVAKGTKHTLRNAGAGAARYVVVAFGGDAGK